MSYELQINEHNKKARLHIEGCSHGPSGERDGDYSSVKYFADYDKAWKKMYKLTDKGYDCADCGHCNAGQ